MPTQYASVPFQEQIRLFRSKVNVSSETWSDIVREQHDAGFMVAGAMKADLLDDLRRAVEKAVTDGTTFEDFQAEFERIVKRRGWTGWRGEKTEEGRAWRARIIYDTNLRTSYQAGRWAQLQAVKEDRPYVRWKHSNAVTDPRPLHVAWDGKVLSVDDPWLQTHAVPAGFGCRCRLMSVSPEDLAAMGKTKPDKAPNDGTYDWTDPRTGETHTFPRGVDPYWDYTPGASKLDVMRDTIERKAKSVHVDIAAQLLADAFIRSMLANGDNATP